MLHDHYYKSKWPVKVMVKSVLWFEQDQLEEHIHENIHLDIYTYYGPSRIRDPAVLAKQDVVLTTYSTLSFDAKVILSLHFFCPTYNDREIQNNSDRQKRGSSLTWNLVNSKIVIFQNDQALQKVKWLRVVLDEGHAIRNPNAQQTKAIYSLQAERKWVLTGKTELTGVEKWK